MYAFKVGMKRKWNEKQSAYECDWTATASHRHWSNEHWTNDAIRSLKSFTCGVRVISTRFHLNVADLLVLLSPTQFLTSKGYCGLFPKYRLFAHCHVESHITIHRHGKCLLPFKSTLSAAHQLRFWSGGYAMSEIEPEHLFEDYEREE